LTYLSGVAQDWFEVALQQEDLGYAQPWLFTWHLFVEELRVHFGLLDPVGDATSLIDNLRMKPEDKIATYNVEFMWYAAQLNWGDTVLCHRFYQGLPNRLQDLIANREQEKTHLLPCHVSTGNHLRQSLLGTKLQTRPFSQYGEGGSRQSPPKTG